MPHRSCWKPILAILAAFALLWTPDYAMAKEAIRTLWHVPTKGPASLTIANGARYFGTVDKSSEVRLYAQNGRIIWKTIVPGATDMLIAKNGKSVIVYSERNPGNQYICFYSGSGRRLWRHKVDGSVWAGAVSPDGNYAAITTAKGYVYLYSPEPGKYRYRRWRMDGIVNSAEFTPDAKKLIMGTFQKSMLAAYDINGRFLWRSKLNSENKYNVQVSSDGRTILTTLSFDNHNSNSEIALWNTGGSLLWRRYIDGFDANSLVSSQSKFVAVSYKRLISPNDSDMTERKVAVFDAGGRLRWEKGGLFFGPLLVALPPDGESVIVTDSEKSLYQIDKRGRILSRLTLRGTIRSMRTSDDGSRILIYCGDGWLYLFAAG